MISQHAVQALNKTISRGSGCTARCFAIKGAAGAARITTPRISIPPNARPSSSSSTRWKSRQGKDSFARKAKLEGLKSRAAFKLLEIDAKYKIFKKGQTVVDLGYAPGSWSQVAVERTKPGGRIVGIDIIPAQPPKGVSTIQGNFLSEGVRAEVKRFLRDPDRGRPFPPPPAPDVADATAGLDGDLERQADEAPAKERTKKPNRKAQEEQEQGRVVDVVLSDMSEPWPLDLATNFWKRSLSNPYIRMMNTSGINYKDHAGSMDLCTAALHFARDTLRVGGHFVCKFYQGAEDKELEGQLRKMFSTVHREKPESSRSESKEAYFVAMRRKKGTSSEAGPVVDPQESKE